VFSAFLLQFRNQVLYKGVNKMQQQHLGKGNVFPAGNGQSCMIEK
jgi:hypothetical protein